jgi:hypothetical protein
VTAYYRLDGGKLTLAEYWRMSSGVLTFLIAAGLKLIGRPVRFPFAIPRPERLVLVEFDDLPASARFAIGPPMHMLKESELQLVFCHRLDLLEPHRLGASAVYLDPSGESWAAVLFTQAKDRKRCELSCASKFGDGTLAVTTTAKKALRPHPLSHVVRFPRANPETLLQRHHEHLARLAANGLFPLNVERSKLQEVILASEQRHVDFHASRGLYVPLTDEEVDRLRGGPHCVQ